MSAHTPGPWSVEYDKTGGYDCMTSGYHVGPPSALRGVRSVVTVDTRRNDNEDPESEANARLIAAAPEMYEALKLFVTASMGGSNSAGESHIGWQRGDGSTAHARVEVARAVLAKIDR